MIRRKRNVLNNNSNMRMKRSDLWLYLPTMEPDWVDDSWLYDIHAREKSPVDRYWLIGVAVCHVFSSLGRRRGWRDLNSYILQWL